MELDIGKCLGIQRKCVGNKVELSYYRLIWSLLNTIIKYLKL